MLYGIECWTVKKNTYFEKEKKGKRGANETYWNSSQLYLKSNNLCMRTSSWLLVTVFLSFKEWDLHYETNKYN